MVRIAPALWIAWAVVVWNVVFDYVIVVAGREYLAAAVPAALAAGPYPRMDDWMGPAITRGLWMATAVVRRDSSRRSRRHPRGVGQG